MPTIWPAVYEVLLREHPNAFCRIYGSCPATADDIRHFEHRIEQLFSSVPVPLSSEEIEDVWRAIDIWGNALTIVRDASQLCPTSKDQESSLPTVSQVYLEFVVYFLVSFDGLYHLADRLLEQWHRDPIVRRAQQLFEPKDQPFAGARAVSTIRNIRNALAHQRFFFEVENASIRYKGHSEPGDQYYMRRPLEDISLLGELLYRYIVSVLYHSLKPDSEADGN